MSARLEQFRDHCRKMAEAEHKPDTCPTLTAVEPYRPQGGWVPLDADGNFAPHESGMHGLGWIGPKPHWEPPHCPGCNSETDRALFAQLAAETERYMQGALFEETTP